MAKENVFESIPDARQGDADVKTSRFSPRYRALSIEEKALHDEIKEKAAELEAVFDKVKPGRYSSLAMTALEQAVIWSVKELGLNTKDGC